MEINLNWLTSKEYLLQQDSFEQYKFEVIALLMAKNAYLFENDILKNKEFKSMKEAFNMYPEKYYPIGKRFNEIKQDWEPAYFDLGMNYIITPSEFNYVDFLFYWLRNLQLHEIYSFLDFQMNHYFDNHLAVFKPYLLAGIKKFTKKHINADQEATIMEWIELSKELITHTEDAVSPSQLKIKRFAHDNYTVFNTKETALLFYFLQQQKMILKSDDLFNTEAAKAISILTGYSEPSVRIELGRSSHLTKDAIEGLNKIHGNLTKLLIRIESSIRELKHTT